MPGGVVLTAAADVSRIEAPVTWKAYLLCAFASFGGIFFGYDSGYINGVLGSRDFIGQVEGAGATAISSSRTSLIVSILSAGTFFGAIIAGDVADMIGRKWTVIAGCVIYIIGVIIQMLTGLGNSLAMIVAGRLIAGIGVGFESAIVILYMSEIVSFHLCTLHDRRQLTTCSAPREFEVLSSPVTNSVSPSAFCSPPALSTGPRTDPTLVLTESRSAFSFCGVPSSPSVSSSYQTLPDTTSSEETSRLHATL